MKSRRVPVASAKSPVLVPPLASASTPDWMSTAFAAAPSLLNATLEKVLVPVAVLLRTMPVPVLVKVSTLLSVPANVASFRRLKVPVLVTTVVLLSVLMLPEVACQLTVP